MGMSNLVYPHFAYERRLVHLNANMLYPGCQRSSRSLAPRSVKSEVLHRSMSSPLKRKKILVGIQSLRKVRNY